MKKCSKCGADTDSRRGTCKSCWAAYMRDWWARNPEKAKAARDRKKRTGQKQEADRRRRERHPERIRETQRRCEAKKPELYKATKKAHYQANKEKILAQCKAALARRRAADPEGYRRKKAEYAAKQRREDPQRLIYGRMGSLVRQHMKKQGRDTKSKAGRRWEELTGYTVVELIAHLERTIPAGYVWADYLSGVLEVDHIIPDADFRYETVDDAGFKRSWALSNLRLLTAVENNARRYKTC